MGKTKDERGADQGYKVYEQHMKKYDWMAFTVWSLIHNAYYAGFYAGRDHEKGKREDE